MALPLFLFHQYFNVASVVMVFYVGLLSFDTLSNSDRVVYSYLMYSTLCSLDGVYAGDGSLCRERIEEYFTMNGDEFLVECPRLTLSMLSKPLGYSREQCRRCLDSLVSKGFVELRSGNHYYVKMLRDVVMGSYFAIDLNHGRLTSSKVFYFFLRSKSREYGGNLDTWACKLADEFCTTTLNVKTMLTRLKREGLVERVGGLLRVK